MRLELNAIERQELKALHRSIKTRTHADKIKAILMLADGYRMKKIREILLIDEDTIHAWKEAFKLRSSMEDWLSSKYMPYTGKLTDAEENAVFDFVKEGTISDSKEVIQFIQNKFNKVYSTSGVVTLLKRLGFVYKKTTLIPSKYDAEKQQEFKWYYEELEANLKENEAILHMDGVHPQHNTTCTKAWIQKGEVKEIKSNTGRKRINLNGAYNPLTQDVIMYEPEKNINAEATIGTFKKIELFYPNKSKIYCIVDNARYYKNKMVTDYLKTSKIEIVFLPTYSPNLNLIERLWKFLRKHTINNKYYEKFKEFREVIFAFLNDLPNRKHELLTFIGTKLHLLSSA